MVDLDQRLKPQQRQVSKLKTLECWVSVPATYPTIRALVWLPHALTDGARQPGRGLISSWICPRCQRSRPSRAFHRRTPERRSTMRTTQCTIFLNKKEATFAHLLIMIMQLFTINYRLQVFDGHRKAPEAAARQPSRRKPTPAVRPPAVHQGDPERGCVEAIITESKPSRISQHRSQISRRPNIARLARQYRRWNADASTRPGNAMYQ